jgi:hypothetical protein
MIILYLIYQYIPKIIKLYNFQTNIKGIAKNRNIYMNILLFYYYILLQSVIIIH